MRSELNVSAIEFTDCKSGVFHLQAPKESPMSKVVSVVAEDSKFLRNGDPDPDFWRSFGGVATVSSARSLVSFTRCVLRDNKARYGAVYQLQSLCACCRPAHAWSCARESVRGPLGVVGEMLF